MKSYLRSATADAQRDLRRTRREAAISSGESENESSTEMNRPGGGEDEEMPPLLEDASDYEASPPSSVNFVSPPSSSSPSQSRSPALGFHPNPARFAFRPLWKRCVADYSCCLRYQLKLATCCMPRASEYEFVPSFSWLQSRFYPLHADEATLKFLNTCDSNFYEQGWCSWWGIRVGVLKPLLRRCMAHTDVNGFLGCGQMFLTSSEQIRILLQQSIPASIRGQRSVEWPWSTPATKTGNHLVQTDSHPSRLLDVGAGDGHITAFVAKFFDETVATEVAVQMVKRLRARGFTTVHTGDLDEGLPLEGELVQEGFDCITLFNVLDRCMKPRTLLKQLRARLRKPINGLNTSRLILSVPLPLDPSVEVGTSWFDPEESILGPRAAAKDFETSVCHLAEMLLSQGFNLESVSRIPYLSQGDTWRPFYVLDASLWVLSVRYNSDPTPKQLATSQDYVLSSHGATGGHAHGSGGSQVGGGAASGQTRSKALDMSLEVE